MNWYDLFNPFKNRPVLLDAQIGQIKINHLRTQVLDIEETDVDQSTATYTFMLPNKGSISFTTTMDPYVNDFGRLVILNRDGDHIVISTFHPDAN
jgi:hypothetical protein